MLLISRLILRFVLMVKRVDENAVVVADADADVDAADHDSSVTIPSLLLGNFHRVHCYYEMMCSLDWDFLSVLVEEKVAISHPAKMTIT